MKKIVLIGGGTFSHVRNHLSLAAPAFGTTVKTLVPMFQAKLNDSNNLKYFYDNIWKSLGNDFSDIKRHELDRYCIETYLTKMVSADSKLVTNDDISDLVDKLIADPNVRLIVFNPALVDFNGQIDDVDSGKNAERMRTDKGAAIMHLTPTDKIIGRIRKQRKDIFVVGFKTTNNATSQEQYLRGLELLKKNSLNLVVANDTVTYNNMIITPEEARYSETTSRIKLLSFLVEICMARINNKFTRSIVVEGEAVDWNGSEISDTLREVVNHCIKSGAYKPFLGKTVGHFATKISDDEIITSIRKSNFNELDKNGMVRIKAKNDDEVIAYGFKPSVGGQSQRIIFKEHPDVDSIVHFHCPIKNEIETIHNPDILHYNEVSIRPQWPNECGSHQCGKNTSDGLSRVDLGDGDYLKVVYLDEHGPNIAFNSKVNPKKVINYIDNTFDLQRKTGGMVS